MEENLPPLSPEVRHEPLVDLNPRVVKQFDILAFELIGLGALEDLLGSFPNDLLPPVAQEVAEGSVAPQVSPLRVFVENRAGNRFQEGLHQDVLLLQILLGFLLFGDILYKAFQVGTRRGMNEPDMEAGVPGFAVLSPVKVV